MEVFLLTALLDDGIEDCLGFILHHAREATGADAGGALLIADPGGGRTAVELLPLHSTPRRSRAELLKDCKEICRRAREDGEPFFRDSQSIVRAPIVERHRLMGLIQVESLSLRAFSAAQSRQLAELADDVAVVISRMFLREYAAGRGFDFSMVGHSAKLLQMEHQIMVAASDPHSPVMISGERGSGKELAALAIHYFSQRRAGPFLPVNSAAFADTLLSDELFGHERHSFTGAETTREGIFKATEGGTLFFDEVGDMALPVQASLLRVLDRGEVRRIGSDKAAHVDVRIVTATNRDLRAMVKEGAFRADLYDRLNVFRVDVPPLRERREDIHLLAGYFLKKLCVSNGRHHRIGQVGPCLSCMGMAGAACARPDFYEKLNDYSFPGNVRELRNLITRISAGVTDEELGAEHARAAIADGSIGETVEDIQLNAVIRGHIDRVLQMTGNNKSQAARLLGLPLTTLINKMKKLGI